MTTPITLRNTPAKQEVRSQVTIRFAGDSGDGMQLTGMQFTKTSALAGNDLATFSGLSCRNPGPLREPALVYRVFRCSLAVRRSSHREMSRTFLLQ